MLRARFIAPFLCLIPLLTLTAALPAVDLGSVVNGPGTFNLSAGTYTGRITLNLSAGQTTTIRGNGSVTLSGGGNGPTIWLNGAGSVLVENVTFSSSESRVLDVNVGSATIEDCTIQNAPEIGFVSAGGALTMIDTTATGIGSGIISGGSGPITLTRVTLQGRGLSQGNGLQLENMDSPTQIQNCTIRDFQNGVSTFGTVSSPNTTTVQPTHVTGTTFQNLRTALNYDPTVNGEFHFPMGTVTDCTFGVGGQNVPISSNTTNAIRVARWGSITVTRANITRWTFGLTAVSHGRLTLQDSTVSECRVGLLSESGTVRIESVGGAGNVFRDMINDNGSPARGLQITETGGPLGRTDIYPPALFEDIWDPNREANNAPPRTPPNGINVNDPIFDNGQDFSYGEGVTVLNGATVETHTGTGQVRFLRVGRAFGVSSGATARIRGVVIQDSPRGVLGSDATIQVVGGSMNGSGIDILKRHDAISVARCTVDISGLTVEDMGGGIILAEQDTGTVSNCTVRRVRRNSINLTRCVQATAQGNFLQTTVGDPDFGTGLDNIYIDRARNVTIRNNVILDSMDNGVYLEGSDALVEDNYIAGQDNDAVLLVRAQRSNGTPDFDRISNARVRDNTIANWGNLAFKMNARSEPSEPGDSILTAERNLVIRVAGIATPSAINPASWPSSKLWAGVESRYRQGAVLFRENAFVDLKGVGAELKDLNSPGGGPKFDFINNALIRNQSAVLKLRQTNDLGVVWKNSFEVSTNFTGIELTNSAPIYGQNYFVANPSGGLVLSNQAVTVENSYWGRTQGPNNGQMTNADFTPFLTEQKLFHAASSALSVNGSTVTYDNQAVARIRVEVIMKNGETPSANAAVSVMRWQGDSPDRVPFLSGVGHYYLPLVDRRLLRNAETVRLIFTLPLDGFVVRKLSRDNSAWDVQSTSQVVEGSNTKVTVGYPASSFVGTWFAFTPTGVLPATPTGFQIR
jgi:parallel beta-helix repeat protein